MMYMSKSSHLAVPNHQRAAIWTKESAWFHKRVKKIHDPVKIVVPCAVFDTESPIPPYRSMHSSSYIEVLDDHQHVEASQRGLRFRDEVDKGSAEVASIDTDRIPSNDTNKPASIDATTSPSIDTGRVSWQKEFDVCGNLRDGDTTTLSDKSGGKKRTNWKKRKRIKEGSQLSMIPHFSDGIKVNRYEEDEFCTSIDRQPTGVARHNIKSISRHLIVLIDTHINGSASTDEANSISIDGTSDPKIDCLFIVSIDCSSHRPMRPC
ncbi:hypothetical protein F2Q68_00005424 [Brassica cretica]|uniref:Uncharacterized protein n=1 Tax=Brassica cretica TaxID=69181 RepID=A0A8S9JNF6_BRACR|nr:hypothetical protein F2Q68_00005424 [Brassica cretica]